MSELCFALLVFVFKEGRERHEGVGISLIGSGEERRRERGKRGERKGR